MLHYFFVAAGGALGAVARVALGKYLPAAIHGIPFHILFVNVLGCGLMGMLTEWIVRFDNVSANMRGLLISGFLGGLTTFSAFAFECSLLARRHEFGLACLYAILSFGLSVGGFFAGVKLIQKLG